MMKCILFALIGVQSVYSKCDSEPCTSAISDENKRWPGGQIPYEIGYEFDNEQVTAIMDAITILNSKFHESCIHFRKKDKFDVDYVNIIMRGKQCKSEVNGRKGGPQSLLLGSGCLKKEKITHELMHVVGFIHEHNRPDRDEYLNINWSNIKEDFKADFEKNQESGGIFDLPYEGTSIMHYTHRQFAKDPSKPVMTKTEKNQTPVRRLGKSKDITDLDLLKAERLYQCPRGQGIRKTVTDICNRKCTSDDDCSGSSCDKCCWWAFNYGNLCTKPSFGGLGCISPKSNPFELNSNEPRKFPETRPIQNKKPEVCNKECTADSDCAGSDAGCTSCCWWLFSGKVCSEKVLGVGCI